MTMNFNCKSIFWSANVCVPAMLKAGRVGAFVGTALIGGTRPRPGVVWYAARKGCVKIVSNNMTLSLLRSYHCAVGKVREY